jgi:transcriptional regulator with XRE-family HTH domain
MTSAFDQGQVPPIELRHRLRIAREYAGYDQGQLADAIGVSRNTIGNAETGRVAIRKVVLNAWALACGVPATWILTGKPPEDDDEGNHGLRINSPRRVIRLDNSRPPRDRLKHA